MMMMDVMMMMVITMDVMMTMYVMMIMMMLLMIRRTKMLMKVFVDSTEDNDTDDDNYANLIDQLQMNSLSCGCNYTDNE